MTMQLQGIGKKEAIQARELKEGMVTVWNYGFTEKVLHIETSKSGKMLNLLIESESGKQYTRRLGAERLVVIK